MVAQTRRSSAVSDLNVVPLCPASDPTELLGLTHPRRHPVYRSAVFQPIFRPAPVDELAHLLAHHDLGGPLPRALQRALRRRVDADLAADELQRRRVVEVVERP